MGNRTQQKQCEGKPTISGPNVYSISSIADLLLTYSNVLPAIINEI